MKTKLISEDLKYKMKKNRTRDTKAGVRLGGLPIWETISNLVFFLECLLSVSKVLSGKYLVWLKSIWWDQSVNTWGEFSESAWLKYVQHTLMKYFENIRLEYLKGVWWKHLDSSIIWSHLETDCYNITHWRYFTVHILR